MRLLKPLILITLLTITLSPFSNLASAAITDTSEDLIVPAGENYTLSGTRSYSRSIQIYGTLSITPYDGTTNTGGIELSAPAVTVGTSGRLVADGRGYRSQEGPGTGVSSAFGGGAGHGGTGGTGSGSAGGLCYGSINDPESLGSGGGRGYGGGGLGGPGGGRIRINVSGELTNDGSITANGAQGGLDWNSGYAGGGGSGGSIFIQTNGLSGVGIISVNGGLGGGGESSDGGGGGGRIAIAYGTNAFTGTISACGRGQAGSGRGGSGTVLIKSDAQTFGTLRIANDGQPGARTVLSGQYDMITVEHGAYATVNQSLSADSVLLSNKGFLSNTGDIHLNLVRLASGATLYQEGGLITVDSEMTIETGAVLMLNAPLTAGAVTVGPGCVIAHARGDMDFNLSVTGNMDLQQGASILADGRGYRGGGGTFTNGEGSGGGSTPWMEAGQDMEAGAGTPIAGAQEGLRTAALPIRTISVLAAVWVMAAL